MPSLDDRVSLIEERLKDQAALMADIRGGLTEIRSDIRHLGERMDRRFEQVDQRFAQVDQRFVQVEQRFVQVEHRFAWLVGIVLTGFIAVIGGLLGVAYR